ncbi:Aspartyl-tRNA(Asn) amidotransferase subunit A [Candidatus Vidania fulgoroideae]|uniref:Aspartyl-tRNA(Asn) amidotransferase subunit A n=1 Tax=Candidatus Vidania fulgoroideorum TaxID=881286 RepID=A0A346E0G0_9PROT|nr:Aspartyl-tRNA(Asn) amidotransferase subunit A [Candidatus Vidania fulgoroideae]
MKKIYKLSFSKIKKSIKSKKDIKNIVNYFVKRTNEKNKKLKFSNYFISKPKFSKNIKDNKINISFIPYMIKDIFLIKNTKGIANNYNLKNYKSKYNCTIQKILKKNKSIFIGKNNMDEFAIGSYGKNTKFKVLNPWNKKIFPGGSSSGSAVSVSSGSCMFSIATDTGGSIRLPSSINGLTGIKVTYGTISRYGVISFAPTLDSVGIISKKTKDLIKILNKIQTKDKKDKTSVNFIKKKKKKTIIVPLKIFNSKYLDIENKKYLQKLIYILKKIGIKVEFDKTLSEKTLLITNKVYYSISSVEAFSCLSKFDNIRYGKKNFIYKNIRDIYKKDFFIKSVRQRMNKGKKELLNKKKYYINNRLRIILIKKMKKYLKKKYLILPVVNLKELKKRRKKIDLYNTLANMIGFPSISFRIGFSKKYNIPIGMQIMGNKFEDKNIVNIVKNIQNEEI